ncbi:Uncharacterised protein [Mycobacterium tuberculosis]|uniref:Uncharacterized protein n=1 Tax=Mycobacterium tuberculosis TaxID=1773 RepID=A0A916P865_MYCTX|nr:Uncharacterised protein [Mycobacterium tuberculosis]COY87329.1 Uncharacterised protein [Mycobacterium tuberculosis]CPA83985.1 Uncharacterised protein [Mycobacterium tuberculosis]
MTPLRCLGELRKNVRPAFGAEVQHAPHVTHQLGVERMARIGGVEQLCRLLVTLGLGEDRRVSAGQRIYAGNRQSQE